MGTTQEQVYKKQFWRNLLIDARRAHKDRRSRKSLFSRIALLVLCVSWLGYNYALLYSLHDPATQIALGTVLLLIISIFAAVRFSQYREARRVLAEDIASVPQATTERVRKLALGNAAMLERGLGEQWLMNNAIPEGHTPIARQITMKALRDSGAWDDIPTEARILLMSPDGSWSPEVVWRVLSAGELLNTLLWALVLQKTLRPVEDFLQSLSMKKLAESLAKPATGILPTWEMRLERNRSRDYFWRGFAEGVDRDRFNAENEEQAQAISNWMQELSESPEKDFLAGASTIRELETSEVFRVTRSAALRMSVLDFLMELLSGHDKWQELTQTIYGPLLVKEGDAG